MRKRRHVLQVSTFPFLAVLLCAMGSLILLLLVIDRQAKAVARNKARLAAAKLAEETGAKQKKLAEERQAEWAQRRAELHAQLKQQQEELADAVKAARGKVDATAQDTDAEAARSRELRRRLDAELARLLEAQGELTARRAEVAKTGDKVEAAKGEKARLAEDLAKMERAVRALKELREREKSTYSLVPYKGRRGDGRRPLYMECSNVGVTFHPDRLTLPGSAELRAEVERRVAQRRREEADKKTDPYLLMLVRPDGVLNYYRALQALDGVKVGFGYEFIDADWVLDFSGEQDATHVQPWMVAQPSGALPSSGSLPRPPRGIVPRRTPPTLSAAGKEVPDDGLPHPNQVFGSAAVSGGGRGVRTGSGPGGGTVAGTVGGGSGSGTGSGPGSGTGTGWGSGTTGTGNVASLGLPSYGPSGLLQPGNGGGGPFFGGRGRASQGGVGLPGGAGSGGIPGVPGASGGGGWGPGGGGDGTGTAGGGPTGSGSLGTGPFARAGPAGGGLGNGSASGSTAGMGGGSGTGTPGADAGVPGPGSGLRPRGVLGGAGNGTENGGEPGGADGSGLGWRPGGGASTGSAYGPGIPGGAGGAAGTGGGTSGPRLGWQPGNGQGTPNGNAAGGGVAGVPGTTGTAAGAGQGGGPIAQGPSAALGQALGGGAGGGSSVGPAGGSPNGGKGTGGEGMSGGSAGGMPGGNSGNPTGEGSGGAAGGSPGGAAGGTPTGGAGTGGEGMSGGSAGGTPGGSAGNPITEGTGGAAGGSPGGAAGGSAAGMAGGSAGGAGGASGGMPGASAGGQMSGGGSRKGAKGGQGDEGLGGTPVPSLLQSPAGGERRPTRPAPPPLSRILGDRDWVLAVECKADTLILQPWGQRFTAAPPPAGKEHPLVTALRQLIARRQATVRAGEPPYRPMIRFRVHPDGLRSYYFAYPLLEILGVPMSREYVEPPNPLTGR